MKGSVMPSAVCAYKIARLLPISGCRSQTQNTRARAAVQPSGCAHDEIDCQFWRAQLHETKAAISYVGCWVHGQKHADPRNEQDCARKTYDTRRLCPLWRQRVRRTGQSWRGTRDLSSFGGCRTARSGRLHFFHGLIDRERRSFLPRREILERL
jgi:hypothetical protein